jgi:hypothetical protein
MIGTGAALAGTKSTEPWWRVFTRPPALIVIGAFLLWWLFVIASGGGLRILGPWDFSVTGQLGDSFGILSSLMASFAAIFTYQTLTETRRQAELAEEESAEARAATTRAEMRAKTEKFDSDRRLEEQRSRDLHRDNEQTFFKLIELRNRVLSELRVGKSDIRGSDAAAYFVGQIRDYGAIDSVAYRNVYNDNENDLGHYFRTTYHVVRFADERFNNDDAYFYIRLLRAQLSNAELTLIALNCRYGEGREKFGPLVVKYALLHNVSRNDRNRFKLDDYFGERAFDPEKAVDAPAIGSPLA